MSQERAGPTRKMCARRYVCVSVDRSSKPRCAAAGYIREASRVRSFVLNGSAMARHRLRWQCMRSLFFECTRSRFAGRRLPTSGERVQALTSGALVAGDIDSYALLGTPDEERCGGPNSFKSRRRNHRYDIRLRSRSNRCGDAQPSQSLPAACTARSDEYRVSGLKRNVVEREFDEISTMRSAALLRWNQRSGGSGPDQKQRRNEANEGDRRHNPPGHSEGLYPLRDVMRHADDGDQQSDSDCDSSLADHVDCSGTCRER